MSPQNWPPGHPLPLDEPRCARPSCSNPLVSPHPAGSFCRDCAEDLMQRKRKWAKPIPTCVACNALVALAPGLPRPGQLVYCTPCHTQLVFAHGASSAPAPIPAWAPAAAPVPTRAPAPAVYPPPNSEEFAFVHYSPSPVLVHPASGLDAPTAHTVVRQNRRHPARFAPAPTSAPQVLHPSSHPLPTSYAPSAPPARARPPLPAVSTPALQAPQTMSPVPTPPNPSAPSSLSTPPVPASPPPWAHLVGSLTPASLAALETAAAFVRAALPHVHPAHRPVLQRDVYWRQLDPASAPPPRSAASEGPQGPASALCGPEVRVPGAWVVDKGGRYVAVPREACFPIPVSKPPQGAPAPPTEHGRPAAEPSKKRKRPSLHIVPPPPPAAGSRTSSSARPGSGSAPRSASTSAVPALTRASPATPTTASSVHTPHTPIPRFPSAPLASAPAPRSILPAPPPIRLCAQFGCGVVLSPGYSWMLCSRCLSAAECIPATGPVCAQPGCGAILGPGYGRTLCLRCLGVVDSMPAISPVRARFGLGAPGAGAGEVRLRRAGTGTGTGQKGVCGEGTDCASGGGQTAAPRLSLGLQGRRQSAGEMKGGVPARPVSLAGLGISGLGKAGAAVGREETAGDQNMSVPAMDAIGNSLSTARAIFGDTTKASERGVPDALAPSAVLNQDGGTVEAADAPWETVYPVEMRVPEIACASLNLTSAIAKSEFRPAQMETSTSEAPQPMDLDIPLTTSQLTAEPTLKSESVPSPTILSVMPESMYPVEAPVPLARDLPDSGPHLPMAVEVSTPIPAIALPRLPAELVPPSVVSAPAPRAQMVPLACSTEGCSRTVPPDSRFGRCVKCGLDRLKARLQPTANTKPNHGEKAAESSGATSGVASSRPPVQSGTSTSSLKENAGGPAATPAGVRLTVKLKTPLALANPLKDVPPAASSANVPAHESSVAADPLTAPCGLPRLHLRIPARAKGAEDPSSRERLTLRIPARPRAVSGAAVKQESSPDLGLIRGPVTDDMGPAAQIQSFARGWSVESEDVPLNSAATQVETPAPVATSALLSKEVSTPAKSSSVCADTKPIDEDDRDDSAAVAPLDDILPTIEDDLFDSDAVDDESPVPSLSPPIVDIQPARKPSRVILRLSSPGSTACDVSTLLPSSLPSSSPQQLQTSPTRASAQLASCPTSSPAHRSTLNLQAEGTSPAPSPSEREALSSAALAWDSDESELTPIEDSSDDEDLQAGPAEAVSSDDEPLAAKLLKPRLMIKLKRRRGRPPILDDPRAPHPRIRCQKHNCQNLLAPGWRWRKCSVHRVPKRDDTVLQASLPPGYRLCVLRGCDTVLPPVIQYKWKLCEDCRLTTRERERERKRRQTGALADSLEREREDTTHHRKKLKSSAVNWAPHQDIPEHQRLTQYQYLNVLLHSLRERFNSFIFAHKQYLRLKFLSQTAPHPVLFAFDGEYSVVADPIGGAVDAVVENVMAEIQMALGMSFTKSNLHREQEATIVTTFRCTHDVLIPLSESSSMDGGEANAAGGSKVLMRRMIGEADVAVSWDRSHPFIPGQRIALRFHAVG